MHDVQGYMEHTSNRNKSRPSLTVHKRLHSKSQRDSDGKVAQSNLSGVTWNCTSIQPDAFVVFEAGTLLVLGHDYSEVHEISAAISRESSSKNREAQMGFDWYTGFYLNWNIWTNSGQRHGAGHAFIRMCRYTTDPSFPYETVSKVHDSFVFPDRTDFIPSKGQVLPPI